MTRTSVTANRAIAVLAWALAATLAGVVAWWAVSIIGEQSGTSREAVLTREQVAAALADQLPDEPDITPAPERTNAPDNTAPPRPSPSATASPSASRSRSASPATPVPGVPEVIRTWTVSGGTLGASCRGSRISLLFATPADGWSVEVKGSGPEHIEVELKRGETETAARAACSGGTPVLSTAAGD